MSVEDPATDLDDPPRSTGGLLDRLPKLPALAPGSPVPVYLGVGLIIAGFATIAYTWGQVAALGAVPLQLPYVVSGGLTSLALILVGLTVVNIAALRRDAEARERQLDRLIAALDESSARETAASR